MKETPVNPKNPNGPQWTPMAFGTRDLKYGVLGHSGQVELFYSQYLLGPASTGLSGPPEHRFAGLSGARPNQMLPGEPVADNYGIL